MEDQGKRLLIAVAVAFGIMMLWSTFFPPDRPKKEPAPAVGAAETARDGGAKESPPPQVGAGSGDAGVGAGVNAAGPDGGTAIAVEPGAGVAAPRAAPPVRPPDEDRLVFDGPEFPFRAEFSRHGGALKSWELKSKKYEDRHSGRGGQENLVPTGDADRFPPKDSELDLFAFVIGFQKLADANSHVLDAKQQWEVVEGSKTATGIAFRLRTADLEVTKTYRMNPKEYLLELTIVVKKVSAGEAKQALFIDTFHFQDPEAETGGGMTRIATDWRTACYVDGGLNTNSAGYLKNGVRKYPGKVRWAGFAHSYFLAAMAPKPKESSTGFRCEAGIVTGARPGTMQVRLFYDRPEVLKEGEAYQEVVTAYLGPKYLGKLDSLPGVMDYDPGFEKSIDLGFFAILSRPLLWLLQWFQSFVVNWGLAIILLTVVVKLATLYWTTKSMRSMRAMAKLKPQVEELQKKYKEDKQRQQVEIMALYKANKVSPLAGCLPMLLQMPIWFALYRMLMVAAELYQAPFIPGWIDDLTAPDPYYILPVTLTGMMFLQAKLTPATSDSMQQKIMQYGLPIMFGVFSLFFPAGLTLYIFTNTGLTAVHHVWMHKQEAAKAASGKSRSTGASQAASPATAGEAGDAGEVGSGSADRESKTTPSSAPQKRPAHRKKGAKKKRSARP